MFGFFRGGRKQGKRHWARRERVRRGSRRRKEGFIMGRKRRVALGCLLSTERKAGLNGS